MKEREQVFFLALAMLAVSVYLMVKPATPHAVAEAAVDAGAADASEPAPPPEWVHVPAPTLSVPALELAHPARPVDASAADAGF